MTKVEEIYLCEICGNKVKVWSLEKEKRDFASDFSHAVGSANPIPRIKCSLAFKFTVFHLFCKAVTIFPQVIKTEVEDLVNGGEH